MPEPTYPEVTDWLGSQVAHWKGKAREAEQRAEQAEAEVERLTDFGLKHRAERDAAHAAIAQLRYERRLLGWARMTLDLIAAGDASRWEQARREAEDIAQRIVDEIGHPVTDKPALGPSFRAAIERTREAMERYAAAGCSTVNLRQVINLLSPTYPDGNYETALDTPSAPENPQDGPGGADSPASGQTPANPATTTTPAPTDAQEGSE